MHETDPARKYGAVALVAGAYRVLLVPVFDEYAKYATTAQLVLLSYLFVVAAGRLSILPWIVLPLGLALGGLVLRDIWWHPGKGMAAGKLPPLQEYYLQSAMDSLAACMFVFLGQGLEQYFAQAAAVPNMVLFRVTALSLPLIPMIRLLLRPMPDPKSPFEGKGMSAIELFRATCRLNILWAVAYCGTVALGTSDIPNYWPDKMRGFLPLFVLIMFVAVQRDGLERLSWLEKVLVPWEQRALAKCQRFLWRKLKPSDPFYRAYQVLRFLIFACFGLFIEATIRPWVMGSPEIDPFVVAGNVIGLTVCVLTWRYVEEANYATAEAVREELRRLREAERV